jgi:hypothetical protein
MSFAGKGRGSEFGGYHGDFEECHDRSTCDHDVNLKGEKLGIQQSTYLLPSMSNLSTTSSLDDLPRMSTS